MIALLVIAALIIGIGIGIAVGFVLGIREEKANTENSEIAKHWLLRR